MYCAKCGKRNDDGSKFCGSCGSNLQDELLVSKESKHINSNNGASKKSYKKALGIGIIVSLIGAGGTYLYINHDKAIINCWTDFNNKLGLFCDSVSTKLDFIETPEGVVERYLKAINNQEYDLAYECLAIENSEFINKDKFVEKIKGYSWGISDEVENAYLCKNINMESMSHRIEKDADGKINCFTEFTGENSETIRLQFKLTEEEGILPSYKVIDENIFGNIVFEVPIGSIVKMDGIEVEGEDGKNLKIVSKKGLLVGNYKVSIEHPLYEKYDGDFCVRSNKEIESNQPKDTLKLKENTNEQVEHYVQEFMNTLLKAAVENKNIKDSGLNGSDNTKIEKMLTNITQYCHKITSNPIVDMQVETTKVTSVNWGNDYKATVNYEYNGKYTRKNALGKTSGFSGTAQVVILPQKEKMMVAEVERYNLRVKK